MVAGAKAVLRWAQQPGEHAWARRRLSRGITCCPLGSHLQPVRRDEAQEP